MMDNDKRQPLNLPNDSPAPNPKSDSPIIVTNRIVNHWSQMDCLEYLHHMDSKISQPAYLGKPTTWSVIYVWFFDYHYLFDMKESAPVVIKQVEGVESRVERSVNLDEGSIEQDWNHIECWRCWLGRGQFTWWSKNKTWKAQF